MPSPDSRSPELVQDEIERERNQLAASVDQLKASLSFGPKLQAKLPMIAAGAAGTGFVFAGGIGAVMRLLARRSREGHERARLGRFLIVERD
jgi:uncharacterized protein DUF3618